MYNIKISIILPVYNSEKYLTRTLDSLLKQTLDDFELIIINDASTDNSLNIVNKYKNKFKNLKIFNLKFNEGVHNARNLGLKHATGEYLSFIDSDDFISPNFLESMYKNAVSNDSDIVCCNYLITSDRYKIKNCFHLQSKVYDSQFILKALITDVKLHFFVWNKLWKRTLVTENKIIFESTCYEDILFSVKAFYYSKKIFILNESLYYYFKHNSSLTHIMSIDKIYKYINTLENLNVFLVQNNIYGIYKKNYILLCLRFLLSCSYKIPLAYIRSNPGISIFKCCIDIFKKVVLLTIRKT